MPRVARQTLSGNPDANNLKVFLVKPKSSRASTTGTPKARNVTIGRSFLFGASLLSPVVSVPVSVHYAGRAGTPAAVALGLIPALPALVPIVTLAAIFILNSLVATAVTIGRVLRHNYTAAECVDDMFTWTVNPLISLLTLQPFKPPAREKPTRAKPDLSALPAAPGRARNQGEEIYYETMQAMSAQPGGRRDVVPRRGESATEPVPAACGRHAKPETVESTLADIIGEDAMAGSP
jgi:hypothetical protein